MPFPEANDYDAVVFTLPDKKTDDVGRDGGDFPLS
jgi:hypothetical protein